MYPLGGKGSAFTEQGESYVWTDIEAELPQNVTPEYKVNQMQENAIRRLWQ